MQEWVAQVMAGGARLAEVEAAIRDCGLDDDQQAAVWLYAWSRQSATVEFYGGDESSHAD